MPFHKVAVAIITPTHTKKSFELGLEMAKKFDSELTVIECTVSYTHLRAHET